MLDNWLEGPRLYILVTVKFKVSWSTSKIAKHGPMDYDWFMTNLFAKNSAKMYELSYQNCLPAEVSRFQYSYTEYLLKRWALVSSGAKCLTLQRNIVQIKCNCRYFLARSRWKMLIIHRVHGTVISVSWFEAAYPWKLTEPWIGLLKCSAIKEISQVSH